MTFGSKKMVLLNERMDLAPVGRGMAVPWCLWDSCCPISFLPSEEPGGQLATKNQLLQKNIVKYSMFLILLQFRANKYK